jgi:hypothetical protein
VRRNIRHGLALVKVRRTEGREQDNNINSSFGDCHFGLRRYAREHTPWRRPSDP